MGYEKTKGGNKISPWCEDLFIFLAKRQQFVKGYFLPGFPGQALLSLGRLITRR